MSLLSLSRSRSQSLSGGPGKQGQRRPGTLRRSAKALALAALTCLSAAQQCRAAGDQESDLHVLDSVQHQVQRLFERCRTAIVRIEAVDEHGQLAGTGFFIDPDGLLYTSYTVGGESRDIVVVQGESRLPAQRLVADSKSGIAILKVNAHTAFLSLGSSRDLAVATPLVAIGYPMDLPLTPSFGMVAGFDRKYLGRYFATTHIRANVAVQRGQGGAPMLNLKGEVVGILISSLDQGSASFALPVEAAEKVRNDFVRFGDVRPGWIGIQIGASDDPAKGSSAVVREIFPDAPAAKAGLRSGDYVLELAGKKVNSPEDMLDASFFLTAEDSVVIKVLREGEEISLPIQPAEAPSAEPTRRRIIGSTETLTEEAPTLRIDKP